MTRPAEPSAPASTAVPDAEGEPAGTTAPHVEHTDRPVGRPRWAIPTLLVVAGLAGTTYAWGLAHQSLEVYYEAAVRSMGSSWHDFVFGSFDPAGTISVDKLPGALWIQALSVRVFGFHVWAIMLPQVLEGVVTVLVLYRAVTRIAGPVAGIVAGAVVAITPATVALNRGNISDSLLILLLVLAVDATMCALTRGRMRWLVVAGLWVGLAFQAKMLQAWLVLPALGVAWIVAAPGPLRRRALQFGAAAVVAVVVSLSWMSAVSVVASGSRPYVDGSTHDSLFQQVFSYNGITRVGNDGGGPQPGHGASAFSGLFDFRLPDGPGPGRLLGGAGGRDIGWLIPAALVSAGAVLRARRNRPRGDLLRAGCMAWGTWLVIDLAAFSIISGINAYYLAALTPAVAALCGLGVELLRRSEAGKRDMALLVLGLITLTALYGAWLTGPGPLSLLVPLIVAATALLSAAFVVLCRARPATGMPRDRWPTRTIVGYGLAFSAAAVFPLAGSIDVVSAGLGPFDTPYQPASITRVTQVGPRVVLSAVESQLPLLTTVNKADRFVAATYTSILAAPLIVDSGKEFEPIGGFTGRTPSPSVDALRRQVESHQLQTIITPDVDDRRVTWVRANCVAVPTKPNAVTRASPIQGITVYFCGPPR